MGLFERTNRYLYDHPVGGPVSFFGALGVVDAVVTGVGFFTVVLVVICAIQMWVLRRPDGSGRRQLEDKYGWGERSAEGQEPATGASE